MPGDTPPTSKLPGERLSALPLSSTDEPEGRFISVGTKLTVAVLLVLSVLFALAVFQLTGRARVQLVEQKRAAASMVVDLFAVSVTPAVDFADQEEIQSDVQSLKSNSAIVYAAVWLKGKAEPAATLGALAGPSQGPSGRNHTQVVGDRIVLERLLVKPDGGDELGTVFVHFTLAPENARFEEERGRILGYSAGFAALIALLVLGLARVQVITPLDRLVTATRAVQKGERPQVEARAHDELGRLGASFNAMAGAINEREHRLTLLNRRLQQLLDHMKEAIVVFGADGELHEIRSRQATVTFAHASRRGVSVLELLFADDPDGVEAEAFRQWLEVAFQVSESGWDELAELAPREAVLARGEPEERVLLLEFRPVVEDGAITRVMLLATDETEKRHLERAVRENEEVHARQMAAMRTLVAGGGQLLVQVLDRARFRLDECVSILQSSGERLTDATNEQLFQYVHTVKGEARAFDLSALETGAVALEDELAKLRGRLRAGSSPEIARVRQTLEPLIERTREALGEAERMLVAASPIGPAILEQVTVRRDDLAKVTELGANIGGQLAAAVETLASRPFGESTLGLVDSVPRWAEKSGKRARVQVEGKDVPVPPWLAPVLSGALTHLVRNAVAHGIEGPDIRATAEKPVMGCITICASSTEHGLVIEVEDDGAGLSDSDILERAQALGLSGSASEVVFQAGFSGNEGSDRTLDLAGRGTGLSAVREELAGLGYEVTLESRPGLGVRVWIGSKKGVAGEQ